MDEKAGEMLFYRSRAPSQQARGPSPHDDSYGGEVTMSIKMRIMFPGNYAVVTRYSGQEKRERCQKLTIRELTAEEKQPLEQGSGGDDAPTHQITFYDFGCKRLLNARIKEDLEDKVVFETQGKEYEFSPLRPARREEPPEASG
jgi:hypothetical protein